MLSYVYIVGGILTFGLLVALFFISRRSQQVMQSLLTIMTQPERAKVKQASDVLQTILNNEILKIQKCFDTIQATLNSQIGHTDELYQQLTTQNDKLVATADEATKKLSTMSQRLDNTVSGLKAITESNDWKNVEIITDKFSSSINDILSKIESTNNATNDKIQAINECINTWLLQNSELQSQLKEIFKTNQEQLQNITSETNVTKDALNELSSAVATGFEGVKTAASDYTTTMQENDKLLSSHLTKLDEYSKQSKKQLTGQMNTLINTANGVSGQIRLVESSIDKQLHKLTDATELMTQTATGTQNSVIEINKELTDLTNTFNSRIKEFALGVVGEIKTVSGVANVTLDNTKTAANKFSESVKSMATGVRETLIEMNTAHAQLSGQSENLIKMSAETTAKLQPLSELIEKYYKALPDLANGSTEVNDSLTKIVANLTDKINLMKTTVSESADSISESAVKLEDLAGHSRQQMIDLMSDYSNAVNTMQTLNKQMMLARATAPMDAIKDAGETPIAAASASDFLNTIKSAMAKLHEQSVDLTRATGTEIPDVVLKKYHAGDKTIFSKWLAKMLKSFDGRRIAEMLKNDTVFRSQATQFIHGFDKILTAAKQTDTPDAVITKLLKTDLGIIYSRLNRN
ncbi:MAG: hypothetical protein MJ170_03050 [Alphaproteobacteria bacterium]|nr:hypothetical protein [Alphaproteobacteria bacterium]